MKKQKELKIWFRSKPYPRGKMAIGAATPTRNALVGKKIIASIMFHDSPIHIGPYKNQIKVMAPLKSENGSWNNCVFKAVFANVEDAEKFILKNIIKDENGILWFGGHEIYVED